MQAVTVVDRDQHLAWVVAEGVRDQSTVLVDLGRRAAEGARRLDAVVRVEADLLLGKRQHDRTRSSLRGRVRDAPPGRTGGTAGPRGTCGVLLRRLRGLLRAAGAHRPLPGVLCCVKLFRGS